MAPKRARDEPAMAAISVDPGLTNLGIAYATNILKSVSLHDINANAGSQQWCPSLLAAVVKQIADQVPLAERPTTQLVIENQFNLGQYHYGIHEVVGAIIMEFRKYDITQLRRISPATRNSRLTLAPDASKTSKYRATKQASINKLNEWLTQNQNQNHYEHRVILTQLAGMKKKDDVCDAALNALIATGIL